MNKNVYLAVGGIILFSLLSILAATEIGISQASIIRRASVVEELDISEARWTMNGTELAFVIRLGDSVTEKYGQPFFEVQDYEGCLNGLETVIVPPLFQEGELIDPSPYRFVAESLIMVPDGDGTYLAVILDMTPIYEACGFHSYEMRVSGRSILPDGLYPETVLETLFSAELNPLVFGIRSG